MEADGDVSCKEFPVICTTNADGRQGSTAPDVASSCCRTATVPVTAVAPVTLKPDEVTANPL